jgi:hypothetical protein
MKFVLALLLCLFALAGCASSPIARHNPLEPGEPGIHYKSGLVIYETDRLIADREGFVPDKGRRDGHTGAVYCKGAPGQSAPSKAECDQIVFDTFNLPVMDNAEKRMLTRLDTGYLLDVGSTVACQAFGSAVVEAGPIASLGPAGVAAGLGILVLHRQMTKSEMKNTSLYHSVARHRTLGAKVTEFDAWEHGAVGLHNLALCF